MSAMTFSSRRQSADDTAAPRHQEMSATGIAAMRHLRHAVLTDEDEMRKAAAPRASVAERPEVPETTAPAQALRDSLAEGRTTDERTAPALEVPAMRESAADRPEVQDTAAQIDTDEAEVAEAPQRTRTLVLSDKPGLAESIARGLKKDETLDVSHRTEGLGLLRDGDLHQDLDLIVFEIRSGAEDDIAIIRDLRARADDRLTFLGVTTEPLSLGVAKSLIDAGVSEVMPMSNVQPQSSDATNLQDALAREGGDQHDGLILAVGSARGGIGATTFALNLACLLARGEGRRRKNAIAPKVAVVDLDFQNGVLGASIDLTGNGSYLEMLQNGTDPDRTFVRHAMVHYEAGNFDVLVAPARFAPLDALSSRMLSLLLDELRLAYDFVILDLPRALVDWIDPVLARADRFFLLGNTNVHTVRQMRRMKDLYIDDHPSLALDMVISMEKPPYSSNGTVKEAEKFLDTKLGYWIPRDDRSATKAMDRGKPLLEMCPRSSVAKTMGQIAKAIRADEASKARRRA